MEQQSISISKAGIVTTLKARCSVIAAANPLNGRYNSTLSFSENIDLSDPILSRFDVLNVIRDEISEELDYHLSTFVINSHIINHPYNEKYIFTGLTLEENLTKLPDVGIDFLKRYIKYAREKCRPELTEKNRDIIRQFYVKLR
jgi:DNA replication licensing factor MCM2